MMRVVARFFRGIVGLGWPWWLWIGLLAAINFVAPLFFIGSLEARVVLAAVMLGLVIQLAIASRLGFVRLLGVGHILVWVPMLLWLAPRLVNLDAATAFGRWLFVLVVVDLVSLVIDFVDVGRYLAGERQAASGTEP